jgi:hypothetical protein
MWPFVGVHTGGTSVVAANFIPLSPTVVRVRGAVCDVGAV